ncbi:MAG TPA: PLP-dependent aspartate aminotransferase family protein [bacterium]|jgi:methionine-gamma-lyase
MDLKKLGFCTRQIHADGHEKAQHSHCQPIYYTSTFKFDCPDHGASLFRHEAEGHVYTRLGNPTIETLEVVLANLENARGALAFSSGMAAVEGSILPFVEVGDHVIAGNTLYGSSTWIIAEQLPRWGIETTLIDTTNLDAVKAAIRPETRLLFIETPANPTNAVSDIAAIAQLCRESNIRFIVDSTFATPYNQRPLELGANIVVHSATKYLNGHGDIIAGCVMGCEEDIATIKDYRSHTGPVLSPHDAYFFLRGLRTLSLRMERHNSNGLRIAKYLEAHPDVGKVMYPGLPSHPQYETARKQMSGFSGMITFELKGGFEAAKELLRQTELFVLAVSLGTIDSLIQHPASMTHSGVAKDIRDAQGLTDNLIRISVGCEDVKDLIEDLDNAIARAMSTVNV